MSKPERPEAPAGRIVGVDVARGLAVLGMFAAHLAYTVPFDWTEPGTWGDVVNGRPSILFAMLAGVSLAIITGRNRSINGPDLARARVRIVVRAAVILVIGAALMLLDTNIAVILPYYAVLFLLALPALRWRPAALAGTALGIAAIMPIVVQLLIAAFGKDAGESIGVAVRDIFVTSNYPVLIWMAFLLAGLAVGRLDLTAMAVQVRLLALGLALAVSGYAAGEILVSAPAPEVAFDWSQIATTEPHSGSPFEVIGSTGFAIAVLALCLLASRVVRPVLFPLAAVGSMALTAYTAQVAVIAALRLPVPGEEGNLNWLWLGLGALVFCSAWVATLGRGPIERLMSRLAQRASRPAPADRLDTPETSKEGRQS